jgi:glycosyltransferase involved in cell wall biosynthesis
MRFSIVIPVYNRPNFIMEAIDSVFAQTFQDFELIIMDDRFYPRTIEVLKSYNLPVKILSQAHQRR